MPRRPKVFLSHTTLDERDHSLARRLAAGLRNHGADVWIAPENIPVGSDWESAIVSAVIRECSHFLVIISAASTRAEWVLREIELARTRRRADACFTVFPLIVGSVGSYAGSDFIDQFQRLPYLEEFHKQLSTIIHYLSLRPDVPGRYLELTQGFVGREYVFSAIDSFVSSNESGYFTIVGDPGEGKSAIIAEFVRRTGCVAHFNMRAEGMNRTENCVDSITAQLSARFGLPQERTISDYGQRWDDMLTSAANQLGGGERLLLAIDALDEVEMGGHPPGANMLFLPRHLPRGVFILMSRRRVELPFVAYGAYRLFDLCDYRQESLQDVRLYIEKTIDRSQLQNWMEHHRVDRAEFLQSLAYKSEGNFMYLHYVLPEIERGAYDHRSIDELPQGLRGYYEDHWGRMGMRSVPLPHDKIRVIYIMAEVRRPVSRQLLASFSGRDPLFVQGVIDEWRQFLHEEISDSGHRFSVYHASFLDFLHDKEIVRAAGETIEGVHSAIATKLWRELTGDDHPGTPPGPDAMRRFPERTS